MKQPVLLCYNLTGEKMQKIRLAAMRLKIRVRPVEKAEYAQTIAALCGAEDVHEAAYTGAGFEDEMLVMIAGEATLIEDDGRWPMRPGDIAVWPKGSTNGHHLVNESDADCVYVALGGGKKYDTGGGYSDIDMLFGPDGYFHKDGTPYSTTRIP